MKNTVKKLSTTMMLLVFALSNSLTTSFAVGNFDDLLSFTSDQGYTADRPILRGSAPSTVSLKGEVAITHKNIPINMSMRDSDVKQVLRLFADKAGLNIIFKGDITGKVTMDLVNIPLDSAFHMVLETSDLDYTLSDGTLIITKGDDDSGISRQSVNILPVKYIDAQSIATFMNKNIYYKNKPGLSGKNSVTVNPSSNELIVFGTDNDVMLAQKLIDRFDKKPLSVTFKVNHTTPEAMATMICDQLIPSLGDYQDSDADDSEEPDSDIAIGVGSIACTVEPEDDEEEDGSMPLGLGRMTVSYFTQLGTIGIVGGSEQQVELIKEFIDQHDKKQPQALLEISIIELTEDGSRTLSNQWTFATKHFRIQALNQDSSPTSLSPIYIAGHNPNRYTSSDASLVYTLNYLMSNGKARTISNPKIVVTNGQESVIDMTSDYVKTVTSQVVQGSMSNYATTQRQYEIGEDEGIKITVTPFISPDGYVYMNLNPDYTVIADQVTAVNAEATAALEGTKREGETVEDLQATLLSRRNMELKNVRVKDGDTLVIAGMMREYETRTVNKTPILGDIPFIGTFFRSTNSTQQKSELVILVTPKIITESDDVVINNNHNSL